MGKRKMRREIECLKARVDDMSAWIGTLDTRIDELEKEKAYTTWTLPENCKVRFMPETTTTTACGCYDKKE